MTAAKRRAIDSLRRGRMLVQKHEEIARNLKVNSSGSQMRWSNPWIR
jgi:hypothetical protein